MTHLARVLVVGDDAAQARNLSKRLRRQGYATSAGDYSLVTDKLSREEHPDLVIVASAHGDERGCEFADILKSDSETAHIPVTMVADSPSHALRRRCVSAGVDDLLVPPYTDTILFSRLRPLVRLATMHTELQNRAATARAFGLEPEAPVSLQAPHENYRVLVAGKASADIDIVEAALAEGYRLTRVDDPFAASARLLEEKFDTLVLSVDGMVEDALYLCGQIRHNPRLFNLPVLLIAEAGAFESLDEPYEHGASIVLRQPLEQDTLQATILMLVRRQKVRWAIYDALRALRQEAVCDRLTGVYNAAFLDAHLRRLTDAATTWHKHLSLACFQVQNVSGLVRKFGEAAGADLLRQVSDWITALVRVEDLVARADDDSFCVLLPETTPEEAQIVAHRISGVLLNTEFGIEATGRSVTAWVAAQCASLRRGDTADTLFSRVRHPVC